jgi:2-(1,2-epoxy-1,2-dihydrophenyl)acetyl-CoA isomerase
MTDPNNGVLVSLEDGVCVLTLSAPARKNALSTEVRTELLERLKEYLANAACRAFVLTGAAKTFSAGGDISQMATPPGMTSSDYSRMRLGMLHDAVKLIVGGAKPVVAAVEGYAAGAGMSFAAASDFVIAAEDAKFIASFGKIGLIADCGLLWTLPRRVGLSRARDILITARTLTADEALRIGLVDKVVPSGASLQHAIEQCKSYTAVAPLSIAAVKNTYAGDMGDLNELLEQEMVLQGQLRVTEDHQEAREAFLAKRKVQFKGR